MLIIYSLVLWFFVGVSAYFFYRSRLDRRRFDTLFRHAPLALIVVDQQQRIVKWNHQAQHIFQWHEQEVLGKNVIDLLISRDSKHKIQQILASVTEQQTTVRSENWNLRKDGREVLCEWLNAPYFDRHARPQHVICMARLVED